ncbi:hypothetical protein BZG36_05740, partial [Bifiguratus adelaidae]
GICPTAKEFEKRYQSNVLYDYAARNWGHHARAASADAVTLIMQFLENETKVSSCSQAMMARKATTNVYDDGQKMTGVHLAAYFGLQEVMASLVKIGHNPDFKDMYGRTPLSIAAENRHKEVVEILSFINGIIDGQAFGNWFYANTVTPHYKKLRYIKIATGDYTLVNGGVYFALSSDVVLDFTGVTITIQDHQAD